MTKKQQKIKRYRKIYSGSGSVSKMLRIFLSILLLAGLACLGWVLYEPVSNFLAGTLEVPEEKEESSLIEDFSGDSEIISVSDVLPPQTTAINLNEIKGVYLPPELLKNTQTLAQTMETLAGQGVNCLLIDAKDAQGQVLYQSTNQVVADVAAQTADAVDLEKITALAKEHGMSVIAKITAFRDPKCSASLKKAAVKYRDTEMLWLDNAKENGGKSWLNPYSEVAQMYIADLSLECMRLGCSAVMLDNVQFPSGYSLDLAGYGVQTKSKEQILGDFVQNVSELLQEHDGQLIYASSAQAMLGMESSYEKGGLGYDTSYFCPSLLPSAFAKGARPQSLTVEDPVAQPYETVKTVLQELKGVANQKNFVPLLEAPTSQTGGMSGPEYVKQQVSALEACGVTGYILYNLQGTYELQ